ncbi:unnamed protein product [Mytilus edulis]|uniref:Uncharacterized protein n=1 Tax=Mytilus edulis TaxID=6550 RepID=A0A8S3VD42_MYTED|nr:unnamed protein product [Mytilus edulis]
MQPDSSYSRDLHNVLYSSCTWAGKWIALNQVVDTVNRAHSIRVVLDLLDKVKGRNKLIRIADSSPAGWSTVRQYESNDIASDSEDEKKIRQAESRVMRTMKDKTKDVSSVFQQTPEIATSETYAPILPTINSFRGNHFVTAPHGVSRAIVRHVLLL